MENRCVCCGEIIPEGRQVCLHCEMAEGIGDNLFVQKSLVNSFEQLSRKMPYMDNAMRSSHNSV